MNVRQPVVVALVMAVAAAACGSGATARDRVPVTIATTSTSSAPTTGVAPTTLVGPATSAPVATTVEAGCEVTPKGPLLSARRTPASPYFLRHPADSGPDTPTVVFLPGGTSGSKSAAERVWDNYLSEGDGVDDFRIVIPYAADFDLYDDEARILAIVEEVLACHGGDPSKIHIAGYSRGGQIAFGLMLRYPELFATVLGAPGEFLRVEPDRWREKLAGKAVFNGVGENDSDWLPSVKAIHEGLLEAGVESVYVEFPGDGHRLSPEFDESVFFDFWASH